MGLTGSSSRPEPREPPDLVRAALEAVTKLKEGISGAPCDNNIMLWNAVIFGPEDTPWEGGTFKLQLQFSEDYPNKAPKVRFLSKMFHPNGT